MTSLLSHVVPSGQEGFFQSTLSAPGIRGAGWTFRGARIHEGAIAAAFQHRSGKIARIVLRHRSTSPNAEARTEQFAVELRCDGTDATTDALVAEVVRSLRTVEDAFRWRALGKAADKEPGGISAPSVEQDRADRLATIRAVAPALEDFLAALDEDDPPRMEAARTRILDEADKAPCAVTGAQVAATVSSLSCHFAEALAWLEKALTSAPATMRIDLAAQMFSLTRRLGWRSEAVGMLHRLLDLGANDPAVRLQIAGFYADCDDPESALPHAVAAVAIDPGAWPVVARVQARAGRLEEARSTVRRALEVQPGTSDLLAAAEVMRAIGDYEDEAGLLRRVIGQEASDVEAALRLAQLALWRGDHEAARTLAARCLDARPESPVALRYRGAAALFSGDPASALGDLTRSLEMAPDDPEALLLRAEALGLSGRRSDAREELGKLQSRVGANLTPLDLLRVDGRIVEGEHGGSALAFERDFVDKLPVARATLDRLGLTMDASRDAPGEVIRRWVDLLHGNRTTELTTFVEGRGLRRVFERDSARVAATLVQRLVQTRDIEDVLARFEDVVRTFSDKPYPFCYRAELLIWLGRYDEAKRDVLHAIELRDDARWAYVGLGAVELLTGHPERALEAFEQGAVRARGVGPTTYAYRGECHLIRGDVDRAVEDLGKACMDWPCRVGAWIVLALAHRARGDHAKAATVYRRVLDLAPGLLAEASHESGVASVRTRVFAEQGAVLERAHAMMRGNRSSSLGTWFNAAGALRARTWGQHDAAQDDARWCRAICDEASRVP